MFQRAALYEKLKWACEDIEIGGDGLMIHVGTTSEITALSAEACPIELFMMKRADLRGLKVT